MMKTILPVMAAVFTAWGAHAAEPVRQTAIFSPAISAVREGNPDYRSLISGIAGTGVEVGKVDTGLGIVFLRGSPENIIAVRKYLKEASERMSRQVTIRMQLVEYTPADNAALPVRSVSDFTDALPDAAGGVYSTIADTEFSTLNGMPITRNVENIRGYVKSVRRTGEPNASPAVTEIRQDTAVAGFNARFLPVEADDGSVLMQFSISMSEFAKTGNGFRNYSNPARTGTVQSPDITSYNIVNQVSMKPGRSFVARINVDNTKHTSTYLVISTRVSQLDTDTAMRLRKNDVYVPRLTLTDEQASSVPNLSYVKADFGG